MALAEKYVDTMNVAVPTQKPLVRGDRSNIDSARKTKSRFITTFSRFWFCSAALAVITIVASMIVANKNRQLQDIESQTTLIQRENNTLLQATQELSQYDRVNRIANEQGLKMNEENVRNVGR